MKQVGRSRAAERDEKVAGLRREWTEMEAERTSLIKRVGELNIQIAKRKHLSLTTVNEYAPIHVLPAEILSLIFGHACLSVQEMEIKLSRVCRLWRSISLSSSELWSTFTYRDRPYEVDRLSTYLKRSRNCSLDLRLNILYEDRSTVVKQLVKIAIEHVSRWRRFSLVVDEKSWPCDDLFAPIVEVSAPRLEWFEVFRLADDFRRDPEYQRVLSTNLLRQTFRGGAPLLSCVRLDSNAMRCCMPISNTITTLEIQRSALDDGYFPFSYLYHLFGLPLVNLSLVGEIFEAPENEMGRVTNTTLKTFRVGDPTIATDIWQHLQAPRLEILILKDNHLNRWSYESAPDDPIPALFPSLQTLSLVDCDIREFNNLFHFAHATASITHLFISCRWDRPKWYDVLQHLAVYIDGNTLWPRVTTLTYTVDIAEDDDVEDFSFESYVQFFESRSRILKTHCVLELKPADAAFWETNHPKSWRRLQEGGFYKEMQPRGEGTEEYLPWPPIKVDEFHKGLDEDPFLWQITF